MSSGPYRGGSSTRWVCLVCYRHLSSLAGLCPRCEVDLLSLADPQVRDEVRAEAERRLQKKMYGEYFGLSLLGFTLAIPTLPFVGSYLFVLAGLGLGWVVTRSWTALRPGSALALYAERQRRIALELAGVTAQRALPPRSDTAADSGDPEDLDVEQTLRWLGMPPR